MASAAFTVEPPSGGFTVEPPANALPPATIGPGPGYLGRAWNDVKAGLAAAQPGGGLARQPSTVGNIAEAMGGVATGVSQLGLGTEAMLPEAAGAMRGMMPTLPSTKISQAGDLFNKVRETVGNAPVEMTDEIKSALDSIKEASAVGTKGGAIADKIMSRLTNAENSPLSWNEGRMLYSNIGELTTHDVNKTMLRLLNGLRVSLGNSIENTASQVQALPEYKAAMQGFAQGMNQAEKYALIKKVILGGALTGGLGGVFESGRHMVDHLIKSYFGAD
jgi:hypothetical protein